MTKRENLFRIVSNLDCCKTERYVHVCTTSLGSEYMYLALRMGVDAAAYIQRSILAREICRDVI